MNAKSIDFSGLIATQIQLIEKAQSALLEVTDMRIIEYYTQAISRRLEHLGHLMSLQDDVQRRLLSERISLDRPDATFGRGEFSRACSQERSYD